MSFHRPSGVTAIAILLLNLTEVLIIGSVVNEYIISEANFEKIYYPLLIDPLHGPFYSHIGLTHFNNMHLMNISGLTLSAVIIVTSVGLLRMKKWEYYIKLLVGIIIIMISSLILISTGLIYDTPYAQLGPGTIRLVIICLFIIPLALGIPITLYLLSDIKHKLE
ncbi:MAG: hypothetical protein ACETWM_06475 [Candidatus Lokiarchaeia archaeon]